MIKDLNDQQKVLLDGEERTAAQFQKQNYMEVQLGWYWWIVLKIISFWNLN